MKAPSKLSSTGQSDGSFCRCIVRVGIPPPAENLPSGALAQEVLSEGGRNDPNSNTPVLRFWHNAVARFLEGYTNLASRGSEPETTLTL